MNPHETQEILNQLAATWPRNPISDDTADAWAAALVTIDYDTAKRAVLKHSMSERGHFPPDIADVAAAMRAKQRDQRPASADLDAIRANAAIAHRDTVKHASRITQCQTRIGTDRWLQLLDDARIQLIAEYHTHVIPARLIARRACDIAEAQP